MKRITTYFLTIVQLLSFTAIAQETVDFESLCGTPVEEPDVYAKYAFGHKALIETLESYSLIPISDKLTDFPVRVKILVCADGKFTIVDITQEDEYFNALTVETERLVKLLGGFIPATKNDEKVASYLTFQVNFKPKKKMNWPDRVVRTN